MRHDHRYRMYSSSWTGFAPRSTCQRWGHDPIRIESGWFRRLLIWIAGH